MSEAETIRGDVITDSRLKQGDIKITHGRSGGIEIRSTQIPLDYYLERRHITTEEFRAGERLFRDFVISGQASTQIVDLNPIKGSGKGFSEAQLEARERWRLAISADKGKVGQLMLLNVCCYGEWLKDMSYSPYKSKQAMPRFKEALGFLMDHYKNLQKAY